MISRNQKGRAPQVAAKFMAALALSVAAATLAHAATDPGVACSAAKKKAAGQRHAAELKCHLAALKKAATVDPKCLAKAQEKFSAAFAKAESAGGCVTTGDEASVAGLIDGQLAALYAALPSSGPGMTCDVGTPGVTDCNTCLNCTLDVGQPCASAWDTCAASQDCLDLIACFQPCTDNACLTTCIQSHQVGAQLYSPMIQCATSNCSTTCTY